MSERGYCRIILVARAVYWYYPQYPIILTLSKGSGTNRKKLCRKGLSTTTDETLLCLIAHFYSYDLPPLRNCVVESVLLQEDPQSANLVDGLYHVVSRFPTLQVKNDTTGLPVVITTVRCKSMCHSTQLFLHTYFQSRRPCSHTRYGLL